MKRNFFLYWSLLVAAQILLGTWADFTPLLTLSILPLLIFCLPTKYGTTAALFIAFATGFVTDLFSEGPMGLNILALVPVAAVRVSVIRTVFGEDLIIRQENFSIRKNGAAKVIFAISLVQSLFLAVYVFADGGAARPFLFSLARFIISLAAGVLLSYLLTDTLTSEERR